MIAALGDLARPLLWKLPPEVAHRAALTALRCMPPMPLPTWDRRLEVEAFGLRFPHPLGLAAGFDKNAVAPRALLRLGFGFVEVGTLTPRPQAGNPKPRLFRLTRDAALINRFGFNNDGFARGCDRLSPGPFPGIVGVNFGPNKDASDRIADYVLGVKTFAAVASYLTINISSPNTAGLRDLQHRDALDELVARVMEARNSEPTRPPVLIKIAPDLGLRALDDVVAVAINRRADGLIISNTTIARPGPLSAPEAREVGGLSGRPLFAPSTRLLARAYLRCDGGLPLIGCGGVEDAETALAKIEAGASLIQIYTSLVYRGPGVINAIIAGLLATVKARGLTSIASLVGANAREQAI